MKKIMTISNNCEDWEWEDSKIYLDEILKTTRIKNAFLEGINIGWRRQHGLTPAFELNADNLVNKFGDFEWTVEVEKEGHQLYLTRYSHDEPTGATMLLKSNKHYNKTYKEIMS